MNPIRRGSGDVARRGGHDDTDSFPLQTGEVVPMQSYGFSVDPSNAVEPERLGWLEVALSGTMRRWRMIAIATAIAAVIGVPLALRLPPWYEAGVRMIPAPSTRANAGSAFDITLAAPMQSADAAVEGGELGRLLSILRSRSLTDETANRFKLASFYGARSAEEMRELFWGRLAQSQVLPKEGYVDLLVSDRDPRRAAEIANFMAAQANEISRRITSAAASEQRRFLEHRLEEVRREVEAAAAAYRKFQEDNKLVDIEAQSGAVITTLLRLKDQLIQEELELRRLRGYASEEEPQTVAAKRQVRELRTQLEQLESTPGDHRPDFFTRLELVPALRVEGERLARELRTRSSIYELLLREYEMAKLREVRDTRTYAVLDDAVAATRKARPSRAVAVLAFAAGGAAAAAVLAALLSLRVEARRRRMAEPEA